MAHVKCIRCPLCRSLPQLILAGGGQAFCPNDDCEVILWDMLSTLDENLMDASHVDEQVDRQLRAVGDLLEDRADELACERCAHAADDHSAADAGGGCGVCGDCPGYA